MGCSFKAVFIAGLIILVLYMFIDPNGILKNLLDAYLFAPNVKP